MLVLFADTDMDVTPEMAKRYGYHIISMPYTMDDQEVFPYETFDVYEPHVFYEKLRAGAMPTTSGLSPEKYTSYFEPVFKEGNDILYVHFSEKMSGTFSAMRLALQDLKEKYPERKFYEIDTRAITSVSYNIASEIGDMYLAGKSIDEILDWANTEIDHFAMYFFVEDLSFFARSGRVKALSATIGNFLGIRPIIYMDKEGTMTSISKAIGQKAAVAKLIDYVKNLQDDIKGHRVIITHSDCLVLAEMLGSKLKAIYGDDLNIEYTHINPTAGAHCGPDGVGVCFHAIHR